MSRYPWFPIALILVAVAISVVLISAEARDPANGVLTGPRSFRGSLDALRGQARAARGALIASGSWIAAWFQFSPVELLMHRRFPELASMAAGSIYVLTVGGLLVGAISHPSGGRSRVALVSVIVAILIATGVVAAGVGTPGAFESWATSKFLCFYSAILLGLVSLVYYRRLGRLLA